MWQDSIVEEVRQIRDAYARQFDYNIRAIHEDLKEQEKKSDRKFVSLPPRRVRPVEGIDSARRK